MAALHPSPPAAEPVVPQTGGCLCGKLRFETGDSSRHTMYCHCFFCRRQTGAPVAAFAEFDNTDEFRWSKGRPATYRSSPGVRRKFCRTCGTPLTFEADHYPGRIYVAIGALDDPDRFPPAAHDHVDHKIAWFDTADSLPRHHGSSIDRVAR